MHITLLSNIPHYHHLASALYRAGLLGRYVTSIALLAGEQVPGWLSRYRARKLEGRRLEGVPPSCVVQIRFPELAQRLLPMARVLSSERANWLNNIWFDRVATRYASNCDVLHFVSSVGLYSARAAKKAGASIVCDVRQEHPAFQNRILAEESARFKVPYAVAGHTYERKVLEEFGIADRIVVPSRHAGRTFLEEGFSADALTTIPYGVDLQNFAPAKRRCGHYRVLYAGSITLRKGVQYLLEAFAALKLPGAELLLVGPLDPAMKPILARYEGTFTYQPAVPKLELPRLYGESSVFVLPSLADSFSLATLEAMACGTPVIVSENTGAADCIEHGLSGYVTAIRDTRAIRQHLVELYEDRSRAEYMGAAATVAARTFTWERYGAASIAAYTTPVTPEAVR
jgi:glycosyltransferase involved in cell wall biosynthesis